MTGDADRLSRAGSYVLGLMGEAERERAERDLEVDPEFREAVLQIAGRLRLIDLNPAIEMGTDQWKLLAQRIGEMPHMRVGGNVPVGAVSAAKPNVVGRGLHAVPSRRAAALAIALIVAFAAGYLAARWQVVQF
jgi:anti-sigma-K factor RskA